MSALSTLFKWIAIIVLTIIVVITLFWIFYKIRNKDDNVGFQDYIIDKTKNDEPDPLSVVEAPKKDAPSKNPL